MNYNYRPFLMSIFGNNFVIALWVTQEQRIVDSNQVICSSIQQMLCSIELIRVLKLHFPVVC